MRLIVTDDPNREIGFDVVIMSASEFNNICSHPYIASSGFDAVVIDLRCNIKLGFLAQVLKATVVIPMLTGELNAHSVSILAELYKEKAAELRVTFMKDKQRFNEMVAEMQETYHWKEFY